MSVQNNFNCFSRIECSGLSEFAQVISVLAMADSRQTADNRPPHSLHQCTTPGCNVSFSTEDNHPQCYLHRSCPRTRQSGKQGDRVCRHCTGWTTETWRAFNQRALLRNRTEAARQRKKSTVPSAASKMSQLKSSQPHQPAQLTKGVLAYSPSQAVGSPEPLAEHCARPIVATDPPESPAARADPSSSTPRSASAEGTSDLPKGQTSGERPSSVRKVSNPELVGDPDESQSRESQALVVEVASPRDPL